MKLLIAAVLNSLSALAFGQPLIFSPNSDGVKDQVTFTLTLAGDATISRWKFDIHHPPVGRGQVGPLVKSFAGKGRPPGQLKWDGKDANGRLVKDGAYLFTLSLVTPAGNQVAIAPSNLVVDRVLPQASVSVSPTLFSPNGDGSKDETSFTLRADDGNGLYGWLLTIKDKEGAPARNLRGKGSPPAVISWDGRGDFEEDVPDGTYTFELTVDDLAGNRLVTPPQKVTLNRAGLVSTVEVVPILFSPNGDGFKDEVAFRISSGDPESVEKWELRILSQSGKLIHRFDGQKDPPNRVVWNGLVGKSAVGDGSYQIVLSETDRAGNTANTTPQPMEVDTTPPSVEARLEPVLLSPNADGFNDAGTFHVRADDAHPLESWTLKILNDVGRAVKTITGQPGSKPVPKIPWNGDGETGDPLADGVYHYVLEALDIAGNKNATQRSAVRLDRSAPVLQVSAEPPLFSPNSDGSLDEAYFKIGVQDAGPIESWSLTISDAQGKEVKKFSSQPDNIPQQAAWDGKGGDRVPLPDGTYTYVLQAKDVAGNAAATAEQKIVIGATQPKPQVVGDLRAISPNADGFKDQATFKLQSPAFNPLKEWTFKIFDKTKSAQRLVQGRGDVPGLLQWSGTRDDQRQLPDDEYYFQLEVLDVAGNKTATNPQPIRVDTTRPEISVSVSPGLFSPNGDGQKDEVHFIPTYKDLSPAGKWKLTAHDASGKVVLTEAGEGTVPLSIPWKGMTPEGNPLPDGSYTYIFSAEDEVGNKSRTVEQILRIDGTAPAVALQADPPLFSPNSDGSKDETMLLLDYKDASDIAEWKLLIENKDRFAKTFSGLGRPPRSFPWDGKTDRGLVAPDGPHQAVLSVTDEVGNTGRSAPFTITVDTAKPLATVTATTDELEELSLPMTVAENKEKDLVISLASEVLFDTGQAVIKSQAFPTLMKANHMIRRYPQRKVRIEGHADNVPISNEQFKNNKELSEGRAKAIMDFFAEKGKIDRARLSFAGYGDTKPRGSNDTAEGRRANRRVEIILVKEGRP